MKKLLAVRNDKLGDLILTLPALKIIKSSIPDIKIDLLVDNKYSDIQSITDCIDEVICPEDDLIDKIISSNYNYSISFFSTFDTGYKLWRSKIKKRYAPATKLAQIFYNKKIKQNRSTSIKSEYEYNNDLAKYFLMDNSYSILPSNNSCISLGDTVDNSQKEKKLVFIHPFTGGSSKTLSCDDFIDLCRELSKLNDCSFILHCDSNDHYKCLELEKKACGLDIKTISPTNNLTKMFENINQCDLFIAGSTGPLHVAASLNKKTVGFYPTKTSSTLLRWDTINEDKNKLSFTDVGNDDKHIKVNLSKTAELINANLLN
tara:strand:+ start:4049 stop:4999 length:951 start_codon:yes stop_codon:yes gene_type:complete